MKGNNFNVCSGANLCSFFIGYNIEGYSYIHIHYYIPFMLYPRRVSRGISGIPPRHPRFTNYLAMSNTADITGGKPIAVLLQSITGVSAINPLVALYDIHGGKTTPRRIFFYSLYFISDPSRLRTSVILILKYFSTILCMLVYI
jgi:hypothetical protein